MNPAQELLSILTKAAEGSRKTGFTAGGVSFTLNQANDQITGTFTIPISVSVDATTGTIKLDAKDFLLYQGQTA